MDRKARIREYKETPRTAGVYRVLNTTNGKALIASSPNLPGGLNRHRAQLRTGGHPDGELQRDWKTLGPDAFVFEVLDTLPEAEDPGYDPAEDLRVLEELWMSKLAPDGDPGYRASRRRPL